MVQAIEPLSIETLARMIENGFWIQIADGRMVNCYTGEILSLMEWLMRGTK